MATKEKREKEEKKRRRLERKRRGKDSSIFISASLPHLPPPLPERRRTPKSISHMSFCCYSSWGSSVKVLKVKKEFRLPQRCYLLIFSPIWLLKRRNASFLANYALLLDLGRPFEQVQIKPDLKNRFGLPDTHFWIFADLNAGIAPPGGDFADY